MKIILIVMASVPVIAGSNGGFAGSFVRMGLGAKNKALGNTGVASGPGAYSAFYNPASVAFMEGKAVGLSHSFLSLDRHQNYVGFSMRVPPGAGFTIGWIESGVGDLQSYNSIGEATGEINHTQHAIYFSFGRQFSSKFAVGVSIKMLFELINDGTDEFDYSANGVGIDLGMQYLLTDDIRLGYQIRDISSKLEANTEKIFDRGGTTVDRFPLIHKIGIAYRTPVDWLNVAYDFEASNKKDYKNHFGIEAISGENLAFRIGLNDGEFTFGTGLDFKWLGTVSFLDYVFLPSVIDEGSSHVFSWQIGF